MNKKIIYIICITILVLILAIGGFMLFKKQSIKPPDNNQEIEPVKKYKVTFKDFTYEIPETIKYSKIDDNKFKFSCNDYEAIIEPIIDGNKYLMNNYYDYYNVLLSKGISVSNPETSQLGHVDIVRYDKTGENDNSSLFYFSFYDTRIVYEVELFYHQSNIYDLMGILMAASVEEKAKNTYRKIEDIIKL